jgi:DNA ligase-1
MKQFAKLVGQLGTTGSTLQKINALAEYFSLAADADKIWVIAIFSGRRPKRTISSSLLKSWCMEIAQLPAWLFEESYHTVGDLAETIGLLLPPGKETSHHLPLHSYIQSLIELQKADDDTKKAFILRCWSELDKESLFVFNKLITGGFRIGVSQQTMVNALAKLVELPASTITHRISGQWDPSAISFQELFSGDAQQQDHSKPYPFYLAYALEEEPAALGEPDEWQAEWKWDGIRGQIIKRNNELFIWSRGEELMTERFPELHILKEHLDNGTVLDGELLPARNGIPLPFSILQTRIGRKQVSKKQLQEAPVAFFAYDILEWQGQDIREQSMEERRTLLTQLCNQIPIAPLYISPIVSFNNWTTLAAIREGSREQLAEGLMLKRKNSPYQTGRKKGDWWKWKIDPLTIDAVLLYAQKGHGRRSNLYTDYTFAVKDGEKLVTFTKAYSGLTDKELTEVDAFVKKHALEKFGPVRTVTPQLVFEIAFEGIAASSRHKSGVALRFPRISRWRRDKGPNDINTLEDLKKMLELYGK